MSTTTATAAVLPQENVDALVAAYKAYAEVNATRPGEIADPTARAKATDRRSKDRQVTAKRLANLVLAGRNAGWPVRVLAAPLGITPERLRQIAKDWGTGARGTRPAFPKYAPLVERKVVPPKKPKVTSHLTKAEARKLAALAEDAPRNTGSRPLNSPYRKASEEFSRLLMEFHDRGVVWKELADASGYTVTGVRMRAARHGYGKGAPPSIQPYRKIVIHGGGKVEADAAVAKPDKQSKSA